MGGWIKLEKDLRDDPRVREIARQLAGCSVTHQALHPVTLRTLVLGGLVKLWCYADTHISDGHDTLDATLDDVDEIVGIEGFAQVLPPDWLQVVNPKQVKFPNYHRHNGTEAKKKAVTLDRVHKHRNTAKSRNAKSVTPKQNTVTLPALPDRDLDQDPDQDRKDQESVALHGSLPVADWQNWLAYRRERRFPMNPRVLKLHLAELIQYETDVQRSMINTSMNAGWQGIFPPKGNGRAAAPRPVRNLSAPPASEDPFARK